MYAIKFYSLPYRIATSIRINIFTEFDRTGSRDPVSRMNRDQLRGFLRACDVCEETFSFLLIFKALRHGEYNIIYIEREYNIKIKATENIICENE